MHAVTESLVVAGVRGTLHHATFHRFFSRARGCLDEVGHLLLLKLVARGYRSAGKPLLKIVTVKVPNGELSLRAFFCTDCTRTARWVDPLLLLAGLQTSTPPPQPKAA